MMRVAEVARRLDVSDKVVYALLESGRLRAYRVGAGRGSYRVTEDQLRAYLESTLTDAPIGASVAPPMSARREPVFKHDRPGRKRFIYPEHDAPPRP